MIIYQIYTCNVIRYSILMYFCYISVLMIFSLINEKVKYDQKVNCQIIRESLRNMMGMKASTDVHFESIKRYFNR